MSTARPKPVYEPDRYWNERLEKEFSLAGVGHSSVGLRFNRWAYKVRKQVLIRTLRDFDISLSKEQILELGFGTGFYLDLWREMGAAHVTGFDIADVAVASGRERLKDTGWSLNRGDIGGPLELGPAEGSCTLATAFDVLFHLVEDSSWNGALDNLSRALKPGGHVIIFDKFQKKESGVSHVKRRTLEAYQEALLKRGFEIRTVRPIFYFMNSPATHRGAKKFLAKTAWSLAKTPYKLGKIVGLGETFGGLAGAALYLPELMLSRLFSSGPSTKLLLARKGSP